MEVKEDLISAKEAARRLGISTAQLSRLVSSNSIGVYRIGGRTLFDNETLDAFKQSVYFSPMGERKED
jgi:excisionase family DNA binding protein